jgi:hypothetical protein
MRNKQDITVNKVSSLRDLMRDGDCRYFSHIRQVKEENIGFVPLGTICW